MAKSTDTAKSGNMKKFLILIIAALVLIAGAAVAVYFITRDDKKDDEKGELSEYLPKDYGDDPSGQDDEYTARY